MPTLADIFSAIDSIKRRTAGSLRQFAVSPAEFGEGALARIAEDVRAIPPGATREEIVRALTDPDALQNSAAGQFAGMSGPVKAVGTKLGNLLSLGEQGGKVAARAKRRVGTTGQYVGAPPGVDSPQKYSALIDQYARRIDEALANGVQRGYFYKEGSAINKAVADNPEELKKLAMMEGITSSSAPVQTNLGWGVKGLEQEAMGAPINTGMYPNPMRPKAERVLAGDYSDIGPKTHRYASGLAGEKEGLAPNDRWEMRSMGYETESPKPTQTDFMDEVRRQAIARWNKANPDKPPLSILEGQELNWATQRARDLNISHAQAAENIQDAMREFSIQHSWESRGGQVAQHLQDMPASEWPAYHGRIESIMLDPEGKDQLIRAMGGRLQLPAFRGPGVYEGVVSPGTQSRSIGYMTHGGGLDPTTEARVRGTEAVRAYGLGQDSAAAHAFQTPAKLSGPKTDTFEINLGRTPTNEEAVQIQGQLDKIFGGEAGLVPTETGFRILRFNPGRTDFASDVEQIIAPSFEPGRVKGGLRHAMNPEEGYLPLGWGEPGGATRSLLSALENPAAPRLQEHADSPQVRELMGKLAAQYEAERAAGFTPNPKLLNALRAWSEGGLPSLRALLAKGMAPAVGGVALSDLLNSGQEPQPAVQ